MMPITEILVEPWMVLGFARVSGDRNEPHFPGDGPRRFGQKEGPIAHGVLVAELVMARAVERLYPGRSLIRTGHKGEFRGPVPYGSTLIPNLEPLEDTGQRVVVRLSAKRGDQTVYLGTTTYEERNPDAQLTGLMLPYDSKSQEELEGGLRSDAHDVQPFERRPAGISTETEYRFEINEKFVQGATALLGSRIPDLNEAALCFFMSRVSALHIPGYILLGTSGDYTGCPLKIGDSLAARLIVAPAGASRQGLKRVRAYITMFRVVSPDEYELAGTLMVHKQALPEEAS